jgi:CRISPR/Cas system CSM-associated protein Csm3 (group 7 of RAMP superfamily)
MSYRDRGRGSQPSPLPKPYAFVPLPEGKSALQAPAGHHCYAADRFTGTLTGTIIAHSPVHVASGLLEQTRDRKYPLVKGHFRTQDRLALPGTSLKGCIRSIAEALSRSTVQITRARALDREHLPSRSVEQLDIVQRIFGALGYQGMINFADALLPEEVQPIIVPSPQLFRPRSEAADAYFEGGQARGRKFYMHGTLAGGDLPLEACPVGSRFALQMVFANLSAAELGLVLTALGVSAAADQPRFYPKLGGGKPACLGTIAIAEVTLTGFAGAAAYTDFDATPQPLDLGAMLAAAESAGLVLSMQLGQLAEVLRWPREDRNCPDRNY